MFWSFVGVLQDGGFTTGFIRAEFTGFFIFHSLFQVSSAFLTFLFFRFFSCYINAL